MAAALAAAALLLGACQGAGEEDPTAAPAPAPSAVADPAPEPSPTQPASLEPSPPFGQATLTLIPPEPAAGERIPLPVYVAADARTRGRGLMERDDLPDGTGMVFLFPGQHRGGFYMKNTRIPLSIAFYGEDGRILAILDMDPCRTEPCTIYNPGVAYSGAIEVEQGWFEEVGVEPGWSVELPAGLPGPS